MTSTPTSTPKLLQSEPGGPGESFAAAGALATCAASLNSDPVWLRSYLSRTLGDSSGLHLQTGARSAIIEQSIDLSTTIAASNNQVIIETLNGYLCASSFSRDQAVPLIASLLQSDVISSTSYDARSRETLLRFVTSLHLPPRVLYHAEAALAALVQAVSENARTADGENAAAVSAEDERRSRRRKGIKWLKVGAAGVVGGIALGLSGGLIAPALLPALGTMGLSTAALGSSGVMAVGGLFGAAGASVGAAAMASRTGVVDEFVFEPCATSGAIKKDGGVVQYIAVRVTPRSRIKDVVVPWLEEGGGLLVWELLTSQDHIMVVPGLLLFSVGFRATVTPSENDTQSGHENSKISWLLPQERMEVGGFDKDNASKGKRRRTTGAITVQGRGEYILRFELRPGSLPVNISYRTIIVQQGKDPPLWVMDESEQQPQQEIVTSNVKSLSLTILIPGFITAASKDTGSYPGMCADEFAPMAAALDDLGIQCFALRWDSELLMELSDALRKLIGRMAWTMAAQKGVFAVPIMAGLAGVVGAVTLPVSILGALRTIIGNIWARTISHAEECGYMLAAELASRSFGNRPVVLAGYSAGATVVFHCLKELAKRGLIGLVHEAYFVGAACSADISAWREIRKVVSGRIVNVYNTHDWYLEFYHRGTNLGSVAGTRPILDTKGIAKVENFSLHKDFVSNHMDYAKRFNEILYKVGVGNPDRRRIWKNLAAFESFSDDNEDVGEHDVDRNGGRQREENEKENGERIRMEGGREEEEDDDVVMFTSKGRTAKYVASAT